MVGAEDDENLWGEVCDHLPVAVQGVGVAFVPAALAVSDIRVQDAEPTVSAVEVPRAPVGELARELVRLVLLQYPDVVDSAVETVREREVDKPVHTRVGERRLRARRGQRRQARAFAAGEDEREDLRLRHDEQGAYPGPRKRNRTFGNRCKPPSEPVPFATRPESSQRTRSGSGAPSLALSTGGRRASAYAANGSTPTSQQRRRRRRRRQRTPRPLPRRRVYGRACGRGLHTARASRPRRRYGRGLR